MPPTLHHALRSTVPLLAFDTSTERLSLAVHAHGRTWTRDAPGGAAASAALLPAAHALLAEAGLTLADVRAVAFGRGPGAFTGLRTSCAVAQGLALGLGCPVWPLDSLLIVAEDARAQINAEGLDLGVAMDARMGELYAGRWRWQAGRWQALHAAALHTPASLAAAWAAQPPLVVAGSAVVPFGAALGLPPDTRWLAQEADRPAALARLALQAMAEGPGLDAAQALPVYLRDKVAQTTAEREALRAEVAAGGSGTVATIAAAPVAPA
jgi:tRNA threonylcarbamoyladenosine biosynthesis protein TsaB